MENTVKHCKILKQQTHRDAAGAPPHVQEQGRSTLLFGTGLEVICDERVERFSNHHVAATVAVRRCRAHQQRVRFHHRRHTRQLVNETDGGARFGGTRQPKIKARDFHFVPTVRVGTLVETDRIHRWTW